jgi:hypothetical protein
MSDVIPDSVEGFNTMMNQFVPYVAGHAVAVGLTTGQATALTNGLQGWSDAYDDNKLKAAAASAATAAQRDAWIALEKLARPAIQTIQNHAGVTDEMRQLMGLPIPDRIRTRAAVPTTRPVLRVETREHLQHVLHWRDEATPKSKAKPKGVRGAQVRVHIGPNPPAELEEFTWVALDSGTPYLQVHAAGDAGKMAYYALRWENTRGETGPWSDVVSATIPA